MKKKALKQKPHIIIIENPETIFYIKKKKVKLTNIKK